MPMSLEEIRSHITELSGSGKRVAPGARRHGIYSTFTLPGLDDMPAVRDTKQRFDDFGVPERLDGKLVIDVGCNVGATAFEFARRGAAVVGVEYREDRVALCQAINEHFDLGATFYQADFNALNSLDDLKDQQWFTWVYDIVWCSSVDEYIDNLPFFYGMLRKMCRDQLYFESNLQVKDSDLLAHCFLNDAGFKDVVYVGNGHSGGISRKRKLFTGKGG
jgi:2-polyprenyl-3-methyl-5-hydroxy-6-metoxy-1,4-benzoquinol methylase